MAIRKAGKEGMVDLELDDEDQFDFPTTAAQPTKPRHPWGMRLAFENAQIEGCDLDFDAIKVNDEIEIRACGKVTHVTDNEGNRRFEVQLTHICEEDETEEGDEEEGEEGE